MRRYSKSICAPPKMRPPKVRQAGTLYVNAEGGVAIRNRLDAWRRHHDVDLDGHDIALVEPGEPQWGGNTFLAIDDHIHAVVVVGFRVFPAFATATARGPPPAASFLFRGGWATLNRAGRFGGTRR